MNKNQFQIEFFLTNDFCLLHIHCIIARKYLKGKWHEFKQFHPVWVIKVKNVQNVTVCWNFMLAILYKSQPNLMQPNLTDTFVCVSPSQQFHFFLSWIYYFLAPAANCTLFSKVFSYLFTELIKQIWTVLI